MDEKKQPSPEKKKNADAKAADDQAKQAASSKPAEKPVKKKKIVRDVSFARAYIQCSFNNTIVSITDDHGGVISWASAGSVGFKGTKKGTPFAAQVTSDKAAQKSKEAGVRQVTVFVSGPGSGRETAIRALQAAGLSISTIRDVTPIPHNGCRPPKPRRV
jgi:small subunit ribosomal protein S11